MASIQQKVHSTRQLIWSVGLLIGFSGLVITYWLTQRIIRPIKELTVAAEDIATGNYPNRIEVHFRLSRSAANPIHPQAALPLKGHEVLLVEDCADQGRLYLKLLQAAGAKVTLECNGGRSAGCGSLFVAVQPTPLAGLRAGLCGIIWGEFQRP